MTVITSLHELQTGRVNLAEPVGFVPTMGYLHAGHLSLVQRARQECASVVVSIFVNPAQFGPNEDLDKYPRNLSRDLEMLAGAGVDLIWTPTAEVMYPSDFQTWVTVEGLSQPLEGTVRPDHFRGVATVVTKLFNAVQPQKAYFGQKDAQQVAVIRRMSRDLNFPVEIIVCPTVREPDGLALSSRNTYLSPDERAAATILFRALSAAEAAFKNGERNADAIRGVMLEILQAEPLAQAQYVSCADYDTLDELKMIRGRALLSMAVFLGKTRLIDNRILEET
ncbi:MAG: pantoate--beta-alanine ligase [Chloroflexota bacterium]